MTEKRFIPIFDGTDKRVVGAKDNGKIISFMDMFDLLNNLSKENEQLHSENENLKITIDARDTLIKVCEKKFKDLGFIISVDDDGYVIE